MAADLNAISHVIQLSVAPVFLLTGIGALLGVVTNRLSRIVDRARTVEPLYATAQSPHKERYDQELVVLDAARGW